MGPSTRRNLLAISLLGCLFGSLGLAKVIMKHHVKTAPPADEAPASGRIPKIDIYLPALPSDFQPLDTTALNLPLPPQYVLCAMARNENYSLRRLYVFVIPEQDYRTAGTLEDTSLELFQKLTGKAPAEIRTDTIDHRSAIEYHQVTNNGVGFIWQRSVLVFDKLYAVFYTGNTGADDRDNAIFNDLVCGQMHFRAAPK